MELMAHFRAQLGPASYDGTVAAAHGHGAIVDAIIDGDPVKARHAASSHLNDVARCCVTLMPNANTGGSADGPVASSRTGYSIPTMQKASSAGRFGIVGGAAVPHAPQFFSLPDTEDHDQVERVRGRWLDWAPICSTSSPTSS